MSYFNKFPLYLSRAGYLGSTGYLGTTSDGYVGYVGSYGFRSRPINQVVMQDFFRRIRTGKGFSQLVIGIVPYSIKDGETPEKISFDFYGSAFYHWVILLVNDIVDVRQEWPMENEDFNTYLNEKYTDLYATHHYIDPVSGYEVDSTYLNATPVTNFEYEETINEGKRNIKMLDSKYLQDFVSMFDNLIAQ